MFNLPGVRAQILEVIVRQAIAGAPWREICAGPMQVNGIRPEEVEAEVYRRLHAGKDALSPDDRQSLTEYIAGWQRLMNERKMGSQDQIEDIVTSFYKRRRFNKPSIVFCKSPAMMYFHLMLLTGRENFAKDDFASDSNIRVLEMLSQDQSETFKSNLFESIRELFTEAKNQGAGRTMELSWRSGYNRLKEDIRSLMTGGLNSDLNSYLAWGFPPEIVPSVRRLGTIFDIATSQIESVAAEFQLRSIPPSARQDNLLGFAPIQSVPAEESPGDVVRFHALGLWGIPEILAPGFVLENLEKGKIFTGLVRDELDEWLTLFRAAPMYAFFENICLVGAYPETVVLDEQFRPSTREGAAITFSDDYTVYAIDGIAMPRRFHEHPEKVTVSEIGQIANVALRRLMIETYGFSRYLLDSGAKLIQEDECGRLYRKELPDDEPMVMVCVTNSTMEPDGTYRQYFLRVPPHIVSARAGVAWTFGMPAIEYKPAQET